VRYSCFVKLLEKDKYCNDGGGGLPMLPARCRAPRSRDADACEARTAPRARPVQDEVPFCQGNQKNRNRMQEISFVDYLLKTVVSIRISIGSSLSYIYGGLYSRRPGKLRIQIPRPSTPDIVRTHRMVSLLAAIPLAAGGPRRKRIAWSERPIKP
jgi:hypothetical protein